MTKKKSFNIKDKELAQALSISLERLYEICDFFDSDDEDEWDLKYNEHFVWINKSLKKRMFSPPGAYAICKYIDSHEGRNIFRRLKRWISGRDRRIRSMLVQKKIIEITDEKNAVIFQSGKAFITQRYTREILGLYRRQDILNRAFEAEIKVAQREPLQLDKHFIINEKNHKCFSGAGIARVSSNLGQTLTNPHRREWCNLVSIQIEGEIKMLMEENELRQKRIQAAVDNAKKKANGRCQITGEKKCAADPFNLAVHHVFDQKTYPHLADHADNLLVIKECVHKEFHSWMGGTKKTCDVEDFEQFIFKFANDLFKNDEMVQRSKALRTINRIKSRIIPLA